jgi:hypothetical protein
MKGAFELQSAHDLLRKLRFDLDQLKKTPTDTYKAFNFFVTAEHMKDWVLPGRKNKKKRERLEKSHLLLRVCSHLSNGMKHFRAEAAKHTSVSGTRRTGSHFAKGYFAAGYSARGYFASGALIVELQGAAARKLGARITAVELAERVLGVWEQICPTPPP